MQKSLSLALAATVAATAWSAQPAVPVAPKDEAIVLSPFEVSTSKDRGYEAGETLSGTRLSTPSRFVGAAVNEVTAALIQDLALTSMQDLIDFVPNSASYFGGGLGGSSTGNQALFGISYYVRGNLHQQPVVFHHHDAQPRHHATPLRSGREHRHRSCGDSGAHGRPAAG